MYGGEGLRRVRNALFVHFIEICLFKTNQLTYRGSLKLTDFKKCHFEKYFLSPSFTVNSSYPYKTTGLGKPQRPATYPATQNQKGFTQSGPASSIGPFSISTVVNITIVLISIFVFTCLIYGLSYLRKVFISRKNKKLDHQYTANNNSMYECVDFPHHM